MMPTIVSPVSRQVAVSDPGRSVAFYRDVLGFLETAVDHDSRTDAAAQVARGPARLQFVRVAAVERSILFFEADDAAALRDEFVARGGSVSPLEPINLIKMRMFEIRDPDGHALWFGTSFHIDGLTKPRGQLDQALPILPV